MPEIQTAPRNGEMTQRFISFVMMQAQQIALCLGNIPHPQTGKPEPNLDAARLFIDQLEMIREKTRGNLSQEETGILTGVLADLQMEFVKASQAGASPSAPDSASPAEAAPAPEVVQEPAEDSGSRKRFSKSYGS